MEALFLSTGIVAIAEIGDKTQLLALVLATRFRKPIPIILGLLVATLANHALAAWVGTVVADWLGADTLRWVLGLSFLAMAIWILIPDKVDEETAAESRFGPFLATLVAFFLLEMGDKTQIATIALAARFDDVVQVTMGTTLGMMIANVPAVLLGNAAATRIPMTLIHGGTALVFAILGILALANVGEVFSLG
ncbi:MAG: TMEM165/GDT1 family protein [Rhodospirillum sp.]|nr:TMEM165/GDT1 family protein [Rhodospirillum sp.]MCF8492040.1 TMEM165/GDT1 family protein [Rhodospirillum sp.]MCF8501848.1 TMEM165/GDT1 family protein [Rhodospirillum sp.]